MRLPGAVSSVMERVRQQHEEEAERQREAFRQELQAAKQARFAKAEHERQDGIARRLEAERQLSEANQARAQKFAEEQQQRQADYAGRRRQLQGRVQELDAQVAQQRLAVMAADDEELAQAGGLLYGFESRLKTAQTELAAHEASRPRL